MNGSLSSSELKGGERDEERGRQSTEDERIIGWRIYLVTRGSPKGPLSEKQPLVVVRFWELHCGGIDEGHSCQFVYSAAICRQRSYLIFTLHSARHGYALSLRSFHDQDPNTGAP